MSFTPIARSTMQAYWPMESVSDISGNGRDLTNVGTIPFEAGKFANAANYGTSGTTRSFDLLANPFSVLRPDDFTISFWMRLNSAVSNNTPFANVLSLNTLTDGTTNGAYLNWAYLTDGGTSVEFRIRLRCSVDDAFLDPSFTPDTNWHYNVLVKSGVTISFYRDGAFVISATGDGDWIGEITTPARNFSIGNARNEPPKSNSAWAMFDEFILEERAWDANEVRKAYTQYRGYIAA